VIQIFLCPLCKTSLCRIKLFGGFCFRTGLQLSRHVIVLLGIIAEGVGVLYTVKVLLHDPEFFDLFLKGFMGLLIIRISFRGDLFKKFLAVFV
jgi:hypothetical protein